MPLTNKKKIRAEEKKAHKESKKKAEYNSEEQSTKILKYALMFIAGVVLLQIALPFLLRSNGNIVEMNASDTQQLRSVFFEGHPWLILCQTNNSQTPAVATTILKRAAGVAGGLAVGSRFQIGSLRCDEKLPSGKNVWDRFGLDQASSLFFVGNGEAPESVPLAVFDMFRASDEPGLEHEWVENILRYVAEKVKLRPAFKVSTTLQLRAQCLRKRSCGLVLHKGGELSDYQREILKNVIVENRAVHMVTMDWDKYALSFEDKLPPVESGDGSVRVVFFRQPSKEELAAHNKSQVEAALAAGKKPGRPSPIQVMAKTHKGAFDVAAVTKFMRGLAAHHGEAVKMAPMQRFPGVASRAALERAKEEYKRAQEDRSQEAAVRRAEERRRKRQAAAAAAASGEASAEGTAAGADATAGEAAEDAAAQSYEVEEGATGAADGEQAAEEEEINLDAEETMADI